jgi:hypothetical protein
LGYCDGILLIKVPQWKRNKPPMDGTDGLIAIGHVLEIDEHGPGT